MRGERRGLVVVLVDVLVVRIGRIVGVGVLGAPRVAQAGSGGVGVVAVVTGQLMLLLLSELMILSGGGDFLIILKILLYRSGKKETVYYDHPYECGVVVFEK